MNFFVVINGIKTNVKIHMPENKNQKEKTKLNYTRRSDKYGQRELHYSYLHWANHFY